MIEYHLETSRQMIFLPGPRQVGKTTLSKLFTSRFDKSLYLNWDSRPHREIIQKNMEEIISRLDLDGPDTKKRLLIFDELHKYPLWKNWLKGLFDTYEKKLSIIVTGSAMLDVYHRGQDSMMGRCFLYHAHPLSVAELAGKAEIDGDITKPQELDTKSFKGLLRYGGFPEPYLTQDRKKFYQWARNRENLIFKDDMRDLSNIQEISQIRLLASILREQVGKNTSYAALATQVQVAETTIKRWINTLESLFYTFSIRPWSTNIARSLLKEPKYYLWDWSQVPDDGARNENFVASHLLKAVHYWADIGLGNYELYYLRDKDKREVDFLVIKDGKPWFLVEVKSSNHRRITPALRYFHEQTKALHAFQVVFDDEYMDVDCFEYARPVIVPVQTLLSQLV